MTASTTDGSGSGARGGAIERAFGLTPLQEGMLYRRLRDPDGGLYHGQVVARLQGALDERHFREAWRLAVDRHEAFRTLFVWERRPQPVQVVLKDARLEIRFLEWTELDPDERRRRWEKLLEKDRGAPIPVERAPMMRVTVIRRGRTEHDLLWSAHHAVLDGWSGRLVLREILEDHNSLIAGRAPDRPRPPSFARFVGWLEGRDQAAAEAFWRAELAGFRHPTPLPSTGRGSSGDRLTTRQDLPNDETAAIRAAAKRFRVTLNTMAVAAWARVLVRHSGDGDVLFGVTVSERPAEIPGVERAAGLYLNTIPVRVRLPRHDGAEELGELQRRLSEARAHGSPGLGAIKRWSDVAGADLIESLLVFESFPDDVGQPAAAGSLLPVSVSILAPSDLPLAILVYPADRLGLEMTHDPARVPPDEARRLLDELASALVDIAREREPSETPPRPGPPPTTPDRGPAVPRHGDVLRLFEARVRDRGGAPALRAGGTVVTYAELDVAAEEVAGTIRSATRDDEIVGLLGDRSPEMIAGMIGALKAGRPYLPLDPRLPRRRLERLASRAAVVLAEEERRGLLDGADREPLPLTPPGDGAAQQVGADPAPDVATDSPAPDAAAYVVFTSGSTGEPKGVVVGRRQLAWSTGARFDYYGHEPVSFLLMSPLSVDSSVAGLYWTLCGGGTLVLPPPRAEQDPDGLGALVEEAGVTHTLLLPSLYRALLEHVAPERLRSLRWVAVAGEACPADVVRAHGDRMPGVPLYNEYGPSEATVWATVAELTAEPADPVTIGRPVPGARIHLLDPESLAPVGPGEAGEICIGGAGVALGYLDRPDLTAERFVAEPGRGGAVMYRTGDRGRLLEDGRLEFLGRLDRQVKVRGYRVETAEVERALREYPDLTEAVVMLEPAGAAVAGPEPARLVEALRSLPPETAERLLAMAESGS